VNGQDRDGPTFCNFEIFKILQVQRKKTTMSSADESVAAKPIKRGKRTEEQWEEQKTIARGLLERLPVLWDAVFMEITALFNGMRGHPLLDELEKNYDKAGTVKKLVRILLEVSAKRAPVCG
jgi:hypothetical protein